MTVRHGKVSAHLKLVENLDSEITALAESLATPTTGRKGPKDGDVLPPDDPFSYNDLGNVKRFLQFAGADLLFCPELGGRDEGKWLVWQGTHWQVDNDNFVFELIRAFAESLFITLPPRNNEAFRNANRCNDTGGLKAIDKLARKIRHIRAAKLDADPYVVNCKNGTLDLRTRGFRRICVSADSGRSGRLRGIGKESGL